MQEEILDVVNENDEIIDQKTRSECHSNPKLIHRVAHCWLFNSKGQFLWQQRSMKKEQAPGMWDMSCGGHIPAGENPYEGLLRELDEELGIKTVEPFLVDKYIRGSDKQTEMIYLYFAVCDLDDSEVKLQEDEVEQVKWFDYHTALKHYYNKELASTDFIIDQVSRIYQHIAKTHLSKSTWTLPKIIKDVGFDFRWDIKKVWDLDLASATVPIEDLTWHFEIPFWFTQFGFYDLKPQDVIDNPRIYKKKYERIMRTDTEYPIDIMYYKDRWVILDGLHRLVRLYIEGNNEVKVRKVPEDMTPQIEK